MITEVETVWSSIITPKEPVFVEVPDDAVVCVTNVCLCTEESSKEGDRVCLYLKNGNADEICVAPLTVGLLECTQVEIPIDPSTKAKFYIKGAEHNVHISGYINGQLSVKTTGEGKSLVDVPAAE